MIQIDSIVIAVGDKKEDEIMTLSFDKVIEASRDKRIKRGKLGMTSSNELFAILNINTNKLKKSSCSYSYRIQKNSVNWVGYILLYFLNVEEAFKYSKIYVKNGIELTLSELLIYLKMTGEEASVFTYEVHFNTDKSSNKLTLFIDYDGLTMENLRIYWNTHIPLIRDRGRIKTDKGH